jgi:hypothetical protein
MSAYRECTVRQQEGLLTPAEFMRVDAYGLFLGAGGLEELRWAARNPYNPTCLAVGNESAPACLLTVSRLAAAFFARGFQPFSDVPSVAQPPSSSAATIVPAAIKRFKKRRSVGLVCKMSPPVA